MWPEITVKLAPNPERAKKDPTANNPGGYFVNPMRYRDFQYTKHFVSAARADVLVLGSGNISPAYAVKVVPETPSK